MSADLAVSQPKIETHSFANVRLALYWGALALGTIPFFIARRHAVIGMASAVFAIFALQAAIASWIGVVVRHDYITLPRPVVAFFPVLCLWRMQIPLNYLREATALGNFMGFEAVCLGTTDLKLSALFANRQRKLDFFKILQEENSDIKIYRAA